RKRLGYLRSRGHDVIVLRVVDPAEAEFRFEASAMFRDAESGREIYVDPSSAPAEYFGRVPAPAGRIQQACVEHGIEYLAIKTDTPLELVLFDLLKARMRRSRRPNRGMGAGR